MVRYSVGMSVWSVVRYVGCVLCFFIAYRSFVRLSIFLPSVVFLIPVERERERDNGRACVCVAFLPCSFVFSLLELFLPSYFTLSSFLLIIFDFGAVYPKNCHWRDYNSTNKHPKNASPKIHENDHKR